MRGASRFIPGEEIGAVSQWNFGAVDTASLEASERVRAESDAAAHAREEVVRQQAYADGFAQGRAHATLDAEHRFAQYREEQGREAALRLAGVITAAEEQIAESAQVIAEGVLELACEMARQLLRHELSVNPNALQPVIREALGTLTAQGKAAVLHLHPVDLEVLGTTLHTEFSGLALQLLADPSIRPGDCLVRSEGTLVDARLETRWRKLLASLGLQIAWEE